MIKFLLTLAALVGGTCADTVVPPILDPYQYSTWTETSSDGLSKRGVIEVPFTNTSGAADSVNMFKLDLVGNAQQRGFAHGELMALEVYDLVNYALPKWYVSMLASLDLKEYFPDWLVDILYAKTPTAFNKALAAVWEKEQAFVPPRLETEMVAIAAGVCSGLASKAPHLPCDLDAMSAAIKNVNMLPELIRMSCTMFGGWGSASASGNLLQLRALDFGSGPLANFSTLAVHRNPDPSQPVVPEDGQWPSPGGEGNDRGDLPQAFASVSFPGLVGVITGISEKGVGMSEKVWEVYNSTTSMQAGHYDGEADVLVMRDALELAPNRSSAEDYLRADEHRTFAVFLGLGDYATQELDIVGYREADFHAYTPETMPAVTGQPYFQDLVYVDKHPQPSHDATSLPDLLATYYGNLTMEATAAVNAGHETGDLHIAVYDFGTKGGDGSDAKLWVSVGRVDGAGNYGADNKEWMACHRPYLAFDLKDLWAGTW